MAFGAGHFKVFPGKRIARGGVVEAAYVLPVGCVVAALAILAELALVEILVAGEAGAGQPEETPALVLVTDQPAKLRLNMLRSMALPALHGGVLAFQQVAGFGVVELFLRRFPVNELKVFAVMLGVTANAVFVRRRGFHHRGMETLSGGKALPDFRVAIQALERAAGPEFVATGALGDAGERLVGFGQRAWRNLRMGLRGRASKQAQSRKKRKQTPGWPTQRQAQSLHP